LLWDCKGDAVARRQKGHQLPQKKADDDGSTIRKVDEPAGSRAREAGFFGAQDGRASINFRVLSQLIKA
jgi:hypothetical protein